VGKSYWFTKTSFWQRYFIIRLGDVWWVERECQGILFATENTIYYYTYLHIVELETCACVGLELLWNNITYLPSSASIDWSTKHGIVSGQFCIVNFSRVHSVNLRTWFWFVHTGFGGKFCKKFLYFPIRLQIWIFCKSKILFITYLFSVSV